MKRLLLAVLAAVSFLVFATATPAPAEARVSVHVGLGWGCCWGPPAWGYYAPPPVYYAPPPVVYMAPPPTVTYIVPNAPSTVAASQTSPTFIDSYGRTCRAYQSGTTSGTACQRSDGIWWVVN